MAIYKSKKFKESDLDHSLLDGLKGIEIGGMMNFPEIFETGILPENRTNEALISDGLCGWAICMAGQNPTKNFGAGMLIIAEKVGTATPDGLCKLADEIIKNRKDHAGN